MELHYKSWGNLCLKIITSDIFVLQYAEVFHGFCGSSKKWLAYVNVFLKKQKIAHFNHLDAPMILADASFQLLFFADSVYEFFGDTMVKMKCCYQVFDKQSFLSNNKEKAIYF